MYSWLSYNSRTSISVKCIGQIMHTWKIAELEPKLRLHKMLFIKHLLMMDQDLYFRNLIYIYLTSQPPVRGQPTACAIPAGGDHPTTDENLLSSMEGPDSNPELRVRCAITEPPRILIEPLRLLFSSHWSESDCSLNRSMKTTFCLSVYILGTTIQTASDFRL